jgi:glycosyltransferase involved in cell wall biosynthesis
MEMHTGGRAHLPAREKCDFIYVADGEAHKNHRKLVDAWILLAHQGIYPSLGLTLPARFTPLWQEIEQLIGEHNLHIVNFGAMPHDEVLDLYGNTLALVFPSTTESFGLPLLEAANAGLPIIAAELDYVRDVCQPCQTFNPHSSRSIADAVKRFLNKPDDVLRIRTAVQFLEEIQR